MGIIKVLDKNTVDRIAAGEVIERPASIVKELVENSFDAGATDVTVEIEEGGVSLIRVTDNGRGIAEEDIPVAFLRHATSKIESSDDLFRIHTLGFRGEALSSIAAVSQVEMITKTPEAEYGGRYRVEGGREIALEKAGSPDGTSFYIRNLFYNTPARKKFLKTSMTEASHVQDILTKLALSHPEISLTFINNGRQKLRTSGSGKLDELMYQVFGKEAALNLLTVFKEEPGITIKGVIGKSELARSNRGMEYYFLNGRVFYNSVLTKAIEEAYKPYLVKHLYPVTVLYYEIDPSMIDINVHPSKMEARFGNQQEIFRYTLDAVSETLDSREMIPEVVTRTPGKSAKWEEKKAHEEKTPVTPITETPVQTEHYYKKSEVPTDAEQAREFYFDEMKKRVERYHESLKPREAAKEAEPRVFSKEPPIQEKPSIPEKPPIPEKPRTDLVGEQMELFGEKSESRILVKEARANYRIIGQLFDTYWLVEYEDKFLMIDQHAAHEKVLYERIRNRVKSEPVPSQMVAPPVILRLTIAQQELLNLYPELFAEMGFEIEEFGGDDYAVRGVPAILPSLAKKELLMEIMDQLESGLDRQNLTDTLREKLATIACKAAVKGRQRISREEMEALLDQLLLLENPYRCPHGRPTMIVMTKAEVEKNFKRIV